MTRTKEHVEYTVKGKQVWDSDSTLVVECRYEREAQWLAKKLNYAISMARADGWIAGNKAAGGDSE